MAPQREKGTQPSVTSAAAGRDAGRLEDESDEEEEEEGFRRRETEIKNSKTSNASVGRQNVPFFRIGRSQEPLADKE